MRHSPVDGIVNISLHRSVDSAVIEVLDQGPGVDEADLPRLFGAFYRTGKSASNAADRGTGLGLAIAMRAVKINQGTIDARNATNGGLLITIAVPCLPQATG